MKLFKVFCVSLLLCITPLCVMAQSPDGLLCPSCHQPNDEANNYCTSCGMRLKEKEVLLSQESSSRFYRVPARLFSVPTATVLDELQVALSLGNTFGTEQGESFLGTVGFGIGGIAELELSTAGLVSVLATGSAGMKTTGVKVMFYENEEVRLALGGSLRTSNDWDREERSEKILAASAPNDYAHGLRGLAYEARITTLFLTLQKQVREPTTLHAAIGLSDIRDRNVYTSFVDRPSSFLPAETRRGQWQASLGVLIVANDRTRIIAELQTSPFFRYSFSRSEIHLDHVYAAVLGIRYSLSPTWSLDSGLRYQSTFIGLADLQLRVGLNGVFGLF